MILVEKKGVRMKVVKVMLVMLLAVVPMQAKNSLIKMTKAYHHKGTMTDKLVFYFSQRPICTYVPSLSATGKDGEQVPVNENGHVELEFFLPITQADKKPQKFLTQLGATDNDLYRVRFDQDYAKGGLTCHVVFRPEEIGFHQESFNAITGEYALAFSFLKRKTMQEINKNLGPLIRSAQVKKKQISRLTAGMVSMTRVL
ncbi:MAG: hypothetical protein ACJAZS_000727 [Alteromonas naphthalenivorans]|jgi:hypothetical protein